MTSYYDTLVFSGGAMRGVCMLGALQYCFDNNMINSVHTYIGTSAGAMIAYLLAIGYKPTEIMVYLCTHPVFKGSQCLDIISMLNGEGAMSFSPIYEYLERMTIEKVGQILTFNDVKKKFNKNLIITTYNYTKKCIEYLSYENYPDLPCLVGLRMSSSLPLIFNMFKYSDCHYIDGGICDNFPVMYGLNDNINTVKSHRLGFVIDMNEYIDTLSTSEHSKETFTEYIYTLLMIPMIQEMKSKMEKAKNIDIICIKTKTPPLEFNMSSMKKMELFSEGYRQAKSFFNPDLMHQEDYLD